MTPLFACEGLVRRFGGALAVAGVGFSIRPGDTLGIVGENGAGKSTLLNLLGGVLRPDAGSMALDGEPYAPGHPREAAARGVAFVHQELNLFPNLTVAENLCLDAFPRRGGLLIDRSATRARARELLADVDVAVDPDTPVERLSPGERQLVEVARALGSAPRLLILDEPTTSLAAAERRRLFQAMARLRARGTTVILVSHALGDVLAQCDRVLVLRDGLVVGEGAASDFSETRLIRLMVGRSLEQLYPEPTRGAPGDPVLRVEGLSEPGVAEGVSFSVRAGEVVGMAGLMGSGRSELARMVFGLDRHARGAVRLDGLDVHEWPTPKRIAAGMAFVTEDRRADGLCLEAGVDENLAFPALPRYARAGWIDRRALDPALAEIRRAVGLGARSRVATAGALSGGNQQKVVLGKWLLTRPRVLIVDEPTRGIDVGARHDIYVLIDRLAANGTAVWLISSDLEELIGTCDRILVLARGRLAADVPRPAFDREGLMTAAFGGEVPA